MQGVLVLLLQSTTAYGNNAKMLHQEALAPPHATVATQAV
jgi:hypothetical protein